MLSTASKPALPFSRDALHGYQERAVSFIKDTPSCALWVDMGLGKTVSTLTAAAELLDRWEIGRLLVIAPLRVAINTWPAEIERWAHTRHLNYRLIKGSVEKRLNILCTDKSDIHIINRELVPWLVNALQKESSCRKHIGRWPYDAVVIDEASSFKSSKTARWKSLRKALPYIDRMVQLTGTPASNGLLDVWPQVFLLDRGERLGKTFSGYRNRYFTPDYHGYNWTLRKGADEEIHQKLDGLCLRLSAEDYLELPPRIDNFVEVSLPASVRESYTELEREFLAEFGDETVEVLSAAALAGKLLQFANGAIYTDDTLNWISVHNAKLDALAELVEEAAGQPLLIAYNYKTDAARIQARFPQAELIGQDPETIERWNRGEIPMLLAHPASAGHGLNLQYGGNTVVWFGLNWSLEFYQQFNARLHRQGQERPTIVHHLVTKQTIDESVLAALGRKDATQRALLDALKDDVERRIAE